MKIHATKIKRGRPPKFHGPRRPVTVTLPESTLARLATIDQDRGRAIVKVTDAALPRDAERRKKVEVVEVTPGLGIIIVGPCHMLQKIKGVRLVEVAPARFLLAIPLGTSIDSLELALTDLLEDANGDDGEYSTLVDLKDLVRSLRRQGVFSKAEMLFINTLVMNDVTAEQSGQPVHGPN